VLVSIWHFDNRQIHDPRERELELEERCRSSRPQTRTPAHQHIPTHIVPITSAWTQTAVLRPISTLHYTSIVPSAVSTLCLLNRAWTSGSSLDFWHGLSPYFALLPSCLPAFHPNIVDRIYRHCCANHTAAHPSCSAHALRESVRSEVVVIITGSQRGLE